MATPTTPNMSLIQPVVLVTDGPLYASQINQNASTLDVHDHSAGKGVQVTPAGIDINAPLNFNGNKIEGAYSVQCIPQSGSLTGALNTYSIYFNGLDFWVTNGQGVAIQMTVGGVPVGGTGGGGGSGSVGPVYTAPASYPYSVVLANQSALLAIDTSAARTINLPSATTVMSFWVKDRLGLAGTNNITITPNGTDTIEGLNTSYIISANWDSVGLCSNGVSGWLLF